MRIALKVVCVAMLAAAARPSAARGQAHSVTVVAGARYEAGGLHSLLFGRYYRDLWTTPLGVTPLDIGTYAGGLQPVRRGGGFQTKSLRFRGADGQDYAFRSVDKDPSSILPPELRETLVDRIVQDEISAGHPAGALIVAPLLDAVGVLHADPRLHIMPDDERLGEFRAEFRGMLGTIEVVPNEGEDGLPGFENASNVIGTERLLERIEEDLEKIDAPAFLAARLTDAFLGDWDRHRDQWRWARLPRSGDSLWKPIPRDRDQAFVRLDGWLLTFARQYFPQLVNFGESYPAPLGLTWNGRELDRRLLVELDWPVWDSVATALAGRLTDAAIDRAVAAMPPEYARIDGERMRRALRARRDGLREFARRFYTMLAGDVEIHTTDAAETAELRRMADGSLDVTVVARSRGGRVPVFQRTFRPADTEEIRLFLQGGEDSVLVTGGAGPITVRVIGGGSRDVFADRSLSGGAHFYDASGANTFDRTNGVHVDERAYVYRGPPHSPSQPPRDWGRLYRFPLWVLFAPDIGALLGFGADRYGYGFRQWPYASHLRLRAAFGTSADAFRAEFEARFNRENSAAYWMFGARATGLEVLRFYGFGNETPADGPDDFYKVDQKQFSLTASYTAPLGSAMVSFGPVVRYTETESVDRLISVLSPYGSNAFGQAGVRAGIALDTRDRIRAASRGVLLRLDGGIIPPVWDVTETFGDALAEASAYLGAPIPLQPVLALRAGGRKVWGRYPFADAAFIGDESTVRLGYKQRYAGDAEAHANAELRMRLFRALVVLPADFGVFGLADIGRVWYAGEQSERWHRSAGGGISVAFLSPENTLSLALTRGEGKTGIYFGAGFAW